MKKIITRIFLGLLSVVIIGVSALCAYLFSPEKKVETIRPTVTDSKGNVYLAVFGEAGETYAAVTDADGNIWAAEIDKNGNIGGNVASLNDKFTLDEIPKNYDGPQIDETVQGNDYKGQVVTPGTSSQTGTTDVSGGVTKPSEENTTAPSTSQSAVQSTAQPSAGTTAPAQKPTNAPTQTPSQAPPAAPAKTEATQANKLEVEIMDFSHETEHVIYLAGGCFWGLEQLMQSIPGVIDAESFATNKLHMSEENYAALQAQAELFLSQIL